MSTELIVGLISAAVAIIAAAITVWGQTRSARLQSQLRREEEAEKRKREAARLISRYREPLIHAAYDLQSRCYNLLQLKIISLHYNNGGERARTYVINNTAFLIAQYFGWTEIIRQEGLFLDLGEDEKTRTLNELQDEITHAWLRDDMGSTLMFFKGNQRVIGEQMIHRMDGATYCMTYGEFLKSIDAPEKEHLAYLVEDVTAAINNIEESRQRLILLQNKLINLVDFLDPEFIRFPANRRTRLIP